MKNEMITSISTLKAMHCNYVETSFPSIYSKEDVTKLLNEFAEGVFKVISEAKVETATTLTEEQLNNLVSDVADSIVGDGLDLIDDYELYMSHREVEMTSIDFSERAVKRIVAEAVRNWAEELRPEAVEAED